MAHTILLIEDEQIMLKFLEHGDWGSAFMSIIPKRKGGKLRNGTNDGDENGSLVEGDEAGEAGAEGEDEEDEPEPLGHANDNEEEVVADLSNKVATGSGRVE